MKSFKNLLRKTPPSETSTFFLLVPLKETPPLFLASQGSDPLNQFLKISVPPYFKGGAETMFPVCKRFILKKKRRAQKQAALIIGKEAA